MKKILLVEDEQSLSKILVKELEKNDIEVDTIVEGNLFESKYEEKDYDLIILDLLLPRMNGFQILKKMSELETEPTKVLILSNLGKDEYQKETSYPFVLDYLVKSDVSIDSLIETILDKL